MPLTDNSHLLRESYFFDALSPDELAQIAALARRQCFRAGELVFSEGDAVQAFFLLLSGRVQAYKIGPDGKEMILHLVGPGDVFAEYPVFGGIAAYPAYALCLDDSDVLVIAAHPFKALVSDKPDILMKMLARFSQRIQAFNRLIEDLSLRSVDSRLARYLLTLSGNADQHATLTIQKKTLAAILGIIPETLSRAFKRFKQDGAIQLSGNTLQILDRKKLKRLAETG